MARAHAASACVQSDSIKGLAQSIAKPAYHRLLIAEPALRRAVPVLIIAFLFTICIGAFVQVVDQSRMRRAALKRDLAALADILAERLDHIGAVRPDRTVSVERLQRMLPDFIPSWGLASGRLVLVRSADGHILARLPIDAEPGDVDGVLDAISAAQLMALPGQHGGIAEMMLANGASALATARPVGALPGQVIVIQQRIEPLWGS
ncbi:MAG TPA: PAS domain-containing sensor histidine kinase, partial [Bradyrhizobium sp.]|nr:PAS domain-containing sensor histidine kinase [Bradyrhizobium sp.]